MTSYEISFGDWCSEVCYSDLTVIIAVGSGADNL
jgi:hypothetical protein